MKILGYVVAVIGGSFGAALAAASSGKQVMLTETTDCIGGRRVS